MTAAIGAHFDRTERIKRKRIDIERELASGRELN